MIPPSTIAYYVVESANILFLSILTLTFLLSKNISRHATIPNNLVLWILQSFFASLLLYTGYFDKTHVPLTLCKFQSAVQYGAPPALSAAAVAVVGRVWYLTWSVDRQRNMAFHGGRFATPLLVAFPYIIWILVAIPCGIISGDNVRPILAYCASDNQTPSIISGICAALLLIIACVFQFWALIITLGRYRLSRQLSVLETGNVDTALFVRIAAFSIFVVVALILAFVATASAWSQAAPDNILASIGLVILVIFGSQQDVLEALGLRKTRLTSNALRSFGSSNLTARMKRHPPNRESELGISNANEVIVKRRAVSDASLDSLDDQNLGDEELQTFDSRPFNEDRKAAVDVTFEEPNGSRPPTPPSIVIDISAPQPSHLQSRTRPTSANFPVIAFGPPSPSPHSWRVSTQGRIDDLTKK